MILLYYCNGREKMSLKKIFMGNGRRVARRRGGCGGGMILLLFFFSVVSVIGFF